jgi:sulfopyruvate decarboxylase subunit beta
MLGSMGLASSIGLGLSLNTLRKVWVLDGDGSILMNLGTLSTIANYAKENYTLIILDDSSYGSTGCQPTHTSLKTELTGIAKSTGLNNVYCEDSSNLKKTLYILKNNNGPHVLIIKIKPGNSKVPIIPLTSLQIKHRFKVAVKC